MRASSLWWVLVAAAAAVGCGGGEPANRSPLLPAIQRPYRPPADGRLTERQVQAYVAAVRTTASRASSSPSAASPGGRSDEEPVSSGSGSGAEELVWIRQKVLEAETRLDARSAARREVEIDRKAAAALREASASSTDRSTRDSLARQIADLERRAAEREKEGRKPGDPSETANDALVSRYHRQIAEASVAAPVRR
jgi:hypothetical protein